MGWQVLRQEENAKRIATIGKVFYERALKFSEHLVDLRKQLERSVNAFNATVGSYETKLLPQGRKLKDEASLAGDELAEIPPIDVVPRTITALDTGTGSSGCRARSSSSYRTTRFSPAYGTLDAVRRRM